ncbi:MAG: acyl carrier protein [Candidatus Firestonebacteria bacterium]|nr:acyl carrier protein [Candidatus Firestonebacteria bacterium]
MPEDVEQKIKAIAAEILELPPAEFSEVQQLDRALQTIESVAMLEILVTLERTFQIELLEEEIRPLRQWHQLVELVRKKTAGKTTSMTEGNAG